MTDKQGGHLLNRESLMEWMERIGKRLGADGEGLRFLLWELDSMDRRECYRIEEQLERRVWENGEASRAGFEWMARQCAASLRALAQRLERWADGSSARRR